MFFWNKFCGLIMLFFILSNFSYAQYSFKHFSSPKKFQLKIYSPDFSTHVEEISKISFSKFGEKLKIVYKTASRSQGGITTEYTIAFKSRLDKTDGRASTLQPALCRRYPVSRRHFFGGAPA